MFETPRKLLFLVSLFSLCCFLALNAGAQSGPLARQIPAGGTGILQPMPMGIDEITPIEIESFADADDGDGDHGLNRVLPTATAGKPASARAGKKAKSNPELNLTFDGLNFRQQRLANGGRQFSVEPPDQGLCAGNGFVLESTNVVLNIFDTTGKELLGVNDLNSFYGYAPAIVRGSPNRFGPFVTDPTCLFDVDTQRWFHVVLTLDRINVDPATGLSTSQSFSGRNHLDLAVSNTANPLEGWTIYRIPVQDDGTEGTPDHHCASSGSPPGRTHPNACLGDYPHIGADANGLYLETNEFNFFPAGFHGSQIYALTKRDLADHLANITMFQYDTVDTPGAGFPGFTVWPAQSPSVSSYAVENGGTEYFLSSLAVFTGQDNRVVLWSLSNTQALNSGNAPSLSNSIVNTLDYTNLLRSAQPGSGTNDQTKEWPLGQCIEDATCNLFLNGLPPFPEVIGRINGNDSRMQQVMYANGKVWGALSTSLSVDGGAAAQSGIAYFVIKPQTGAPGKIAKQGYIALDNGVNLLYPATSVTSSGRGVISFTMVGPTTFAGAGYASLDSVIGAGDVHTAQAGAGLQDGFSEYNNVFGGRPRWGDYGAGAVDGNSIWFASEYINQSCNLATYEAGFSSSFGSCGGTRASLGNWATRISKVTP
jgi:hypothetical protein